MEHVSKDLAGKIALVTGSGRNIGRAIALELATKGARVVVNTRSNRGEAESVAAEVRAIGSEALVVVGDVFRLAKAFVPGMCEAGWGRIIHITGPDAFTGEPNRAHVVAAKGGLRALTKALAIELGPHGITVNDVAPGVLGTERNDESHPAISAGAPDDTNRDGYIPDIPVGRLGTSEDVAYACGFLASPRASYYTGIVIPCFGGYVNPG